MACCQNSTPHDHYEKDFEKEIHCVQETLPSKQIAITTADLQIYYTPRDVYLKQAHAVSL